MFTYQNIIDLLNRYNNLPENCRMKIAAYGGNFDGIKEYSIYLDHGFWRTDSLTSGHISIRRDRSACSGQTYNHYVYMNGKNLNITEEEFTELSVLCNRIIDIQNADILSKFGIDV